jgi:hypothetical protein
LITPASTDAREHVTLRDVFDSGFVVIGWVIPENDTLDTVLGSTDPAFLEIMENDLDASFRAGNVADVCDADRQGASQKASQVS